MTPLALPERVQLAYLHCVQCAVLHADHGHPSEGFSLLLIGAESAQDAARDGLAWGSDLTACYQHSLESYRSLFGPEGIQDRCGGAVP
jgi:hypothetical protein